MVTTAINSGVDSVVVSNVSQHRDVNTLRGFVDSGSSASTAVSRAISGALMVESYQEDEVDEGGDSDSLEGIREELEAEVGGHGGGSSSNNLSKRRRVG